MGFTSILIDDRDRMGKSRQQCAKKLRKRQKWLSLIWRENVLLHLVVNFIDGKIMEEWNSSWSSFWSFLIAAWTNTANNIGFLTSSFFLFSSLAISAHCSLLDLLINIIWNFIITILKHILHYVHQVVGIVTFFEISVLKCRWV